MERTFVKKGQQDKGTSWIKQFIAHCERYIIDGFVPKLLKHFCGRDNELQDLDEMLKKHDSIEWLIRRSLLRSILGEYCIDYSEKNNDSFVLCNLLIYLHLTYIVLTHDYRKIILKKHCSGV